MIYFVVELLRNNDREQHSYLIGVYDNEKLALKEAWSFMKDRAGKYGAEVTGYKLNTGEKIYWQKLDSWEAFAHSCAETAKEIQKMLDENEVKDE